MRRGSKPGDTVRVAGIRVGTVKEVSLRAGPQGAGRSSTPTADIVLTTGTKAQIRYLNLVGDRYLELVDSPGSTKILPAGSQIPVDRTAPALDLDLLLGGLKPVIQGLNPQDVNALTASLIQILQGQGGTLESLFSKTSSFSNSLADNNQVIEQLIDDLRTLLDTLSKDGDQFSGAIDRLEQLVSGLSTDRDPIGDGDHVARQRHRLAGRPARPGAAAAGRHGRPVEPAGAAARQRTRITSTPPSSGCPSSTANSRGSAPTAPSSPTTSAGSPSAPATSRAAPCVFPWIKQETGRCAES